jgi:hypothetical protein
MNQSQKDSFNQAVKEASKERTDGASTSDIFEKFKSSLIKAGIAIIVTPFETNSGGKHSDKYCKYLVTCARLKYTPFRYDSPYWISHNSIIS